MVKIFQRSDSTPLTGQQMAEALSSPGGEGLQALLALARDGSADSRKHLAFEMTDLFGVPERPLSDRARDLAAEILGQLIQAFEIEIRSELSARLADKPDVPHALILMLANDEIEVARPILLQSKILSPGDLIDIISGHGPGHQVIIAMRKTLPEAVCDALVETDDLSVIETMLKNSGARISPSTMAYLVEEANWIEAYRAPLVQRQELPVPLAKRLYALVSAALRTHILERFDIDPTTLDDALEDMVVRKGGGRASKTDASDGDAAQERATKAAPAAEESAPEELIRLLRGGQRESFEARFAALSKLRQPRLGRVLYGAQGRDLAVACRALGISKNDFAVIVFLCHRDGPAAEVEDPRAVAQVIEFFDQMEPSAAMLRLRQWQRDECYATAIDDVERSREPADDA